MEIYKAALIGIAGVLFGLLFKGYREEYTLYLSLTAGLLILFLAGTQLKEVAEAVRLLQENLSTSCKELAICSGLEVCALHGRRL